MLHPAAWLAVRPRGRRPTPETGNDPVPWSEVICPRCGTVAAGQATTCSRCGGRVDRARASDHLPPPPVPRAPTERGELAQRAAGIVPQILVRPKPVPAPVAPAAADRPSSSSPAPAGEPSSAPGSGAQVWPPPPAQWEPGPAGAPAVPGPPAAAPAATPTVPVSVSTYSPPPAQGPPSQGPAQAPTTRSQFQAPPNSGFPVHEPAAQPPYQAPAPPAEGTPPSPVAPPVTAPGWAPPGPAWNQSGGPDFGGSTAGWAPTASSRRRFPGSPTRTGTPSNYLWQSLVCIFLFLPSALVAIAYSTQVNRRVHVGDMTGAIRASRLARAWCVVTVVVFAALLLWTMVRGSVI